MTRFAPAVLIVALCGLIALSRLHTFHEPLERDIEIYTVVGHEMLAGERLYSDVFDLKPPAIFVSFAAAEVVVGYGAPQAYLLGTLLAIVTLLGLYWMAAHALGDRVAGLWAAAAWAVLSMDMVLQANQPNTESFINAAMVWAFALLLAADPRQARSGRATGAGLLFALATLYKQVALFPSGLILLADAVVGPHRRPALRRAAWIGLLVAGAWVLMALWFLIAGQFREFYGTLFRYGQEYVSQDGSGLFGNLVRGLAPRALIPAPAGVLRWLALPALLFAVVTLPRRQRRWWLYLGWAAGTYLAFAAPGRYYWHYYQLWFPVIAVGIGMLIVEMRRLEGRRRHLAHVAGGLALAALLSRTLPDFALDAVEWSEMKYGREFSHARCVAHALDARLDSGETVFQWGAEPAFYTIGRRRPTTPLVNAWFALPEYGGTLSARLTELTVEQLHRAPPDVVVLENRTVTDTAPDHPVLRWANERYTIVDRPPGYVITARKGGAVERRLALLGDEDLPSARCK